LLSLTSQKFNKADVEEDARSTRSMEREDLKKFHVVLISVQVFFYPKDQKTKVERPGSIEC